MPDGNRFRHQQYPTTPTFRPAFHTLQSSGHDGFDFSTLHTALRVRDVVVVHGTFMGDDPFGVYDIMESFGDHAPLLRRPLQALADRMKERLQPIADDITGDIGNYSDDFLNRFQELVGDDPRIQRLDPTWSGQNHHFARADLAIRLLCRLADIAPAEDEVVLLWGHSHAGNGFAILTNLLANDRAAVATFFEAAGHPSKPHWQRAKAILDAEDGPHPWARSVAIATFGTPVRYGWDTDGYRTLVHVLHHRSADNRLTARPVFPFQQPLDILNAQYGDWVQSFAIAGTDVTTLTANKPNQNLKPFLEQSLRDPQLQADTRFLAPARIRNVCARWKTGTRCHADGQCFLANYTPCGRRTALGTPIEYSLFGHGVATTVDWLPSHLQLVMQAMG